MHDTLARSAQAAVGWVHVSGRDLDYLAADENRRVLRSTPAYFAHW